jgi:SAC3 family protein LENG8/THP3
LRITGTGTFLEKPYLRLTSIPDPSSVRSEAVLKKAVEFVKQKWKQGAGWHYVTDQFKSIRQDLTVQGIYNEFTVQVYETHARLCLENVRQE